MDIRLITLIAVLLLILCALFWFAYCDDRRARRERSQTKVYRAYYAPYNPTHRAYQQWLDKQDISTWPHEVQPGADERKEAQS